MKSFSIRLLVLAVLCFVLLGFFFSREIYVSTFEDVKRSFGSSQASSRLTASDYAHIVGFRLKDLTRDLSSVEVKGLTALIDGDGWAVLDFEMRNKGDVRFPDLKVLLQGGDGTVMRTLRLTPSEYGATGGFSVQQVRVRVQLRNGEKKVAIAPYYEGAHK